MSDPDVQKALEEIQSSDKSHETESTGACFLLENGEVKKCANDTTKKQCGELAEALGYKPHWKAGERCPY
jgi:hypothetical protein